METDRDTSLQSWEFLILFLPRSLERTLRAVVDRASAFVEVVVVDAGSTDDTAATARRVAAGLDPARATLVLAESRGLGRGPALRVGAGLASGDAVLFLHGDTRPPEAYDAAIYAALAAPSTALCAFGFELDVDKATLWRAAIEFGARLRSRYLELPWGDQGLAVSKRTLARLGGVADIPLLEDVDLVLRARRAGEVTVLDGAPARTSPRRFLRAGVLKSNAINALTLLWWHVGATPTQLFRLYYGK